MLFSLRGGSAFGLSKAMIYVAKRLFCRIVIRLICGSTSREFVVIPPNVERTMSEAKLRELLRRADEAKTKAEATLERTRQRLKEAAERSRGGAGRLRS